MSSQTPEPEGASKPWRAVALLVAGAYFMQYLDGTVIVTALPQMGRAFHVSAVAMNIGITAFLLSLAVFIPVSGWAADRFGARIVFGSALATFTLASLLCGLSNGLWSFTAARLLQGIGGAAMVPVGRLMVLRMTEKRHLIQAWATLVWPALTAPVLGPPLGGFIVLHASWRWIFFINIPLGIIAMAATYVLVPNTRGEDPDRPLDVLGFLLSGASLSLLVYGVETLGGRHGDMGLALALVLAGVVLGAVCVRHFDRHPTPLLNFAPLKVRTFAIAFWGGSAMRMSISAAPFLLPLLFQVGFKMDALTSGGLVLFIFAGNLSMKVFTTRLLRTFGFRPLMISTGVLTAVAIAACALLSPTTPYWLIALILFAGGLFRSLQYTSLNTIQFADIDPARLTSANTLASMVQQLTAGLGVMLGALSLNASIALRGGEAGHPALGDFRNAFLVVTLVTLLGVADILRLPADAGRELAKKA